MSSISPQDQPPRRVHRSRGTFRARDLHPGDVAAAADRFLAGRSESAPDDCWLWRGNQPMENGYARIWLSKTAGRHWVHRVAWVLASGESLTGNLVVDHLCTNRLCVNPSHLEPVTHRENSQRATERLRLEGRWKTPEEISAYYTERKRQWRIANPDKARAEYQRPRECLSCGSVMPSGSMSWHRRRYHPEAA